MPVQKKASRHPIASVVHLLFKVAAMLTYLFSELFRVNFTTAFVACVVLLAVDFWVVKNITGRLLVGLRWWNEVKQDGSSEWVFESVEVKKNK